MRWTPTRASSPAAQPPGRGLTSSARARHRSPWRSVLRRLRRPPRWASRSRSFLPIIRYTGCWSPWIDICVRATSIYGWVGWKRYVKMIDTRVMRRWLLAATGSAGIAVLRLPPAAAPGGLTHAAARGGLATSLAQGPTVAIESQAGANPSVSSDGRFVVYSGPPATAHDEAATTHWRRTT